RAARLPPVRGREPWIPPGRDDRALVRGRAGLPRSGAWLRPAGRGSARTRLTPARSGREERRELRGEALTDARVHERPTLLVALVEELPRLVDLREQIAALVRHECAHLDLGKRQGVLDDAAQLIDALAGAGRDEDRARREAREHEPRRVAHEIDLVEYDDLGHAARADLREHVADGLQLPRRIR